MFSIIIPVFNESKNIQLLLNEIELSLKEYENYEIIVVNDCSTDNSTDIITKIKNSKIKLLNNKRNEGQSYCVYKGVKSSINKTIITIDGDGQNDPSDIPKLLKKYLSRNDIEMVGGIRLKRQDSVLKIFSSKVANIIRSKILDDKCIDTGCSLKVFNKNVFLTFPYFDGMHRFLPALFRGFGYETVFINVNHRKRKFGISKYGTMNRLFKGIRDLIKVKKIISKKFHE